MKIASLHRFLAAAAVVPVVSVQLSASALAVVQSPEPNLEEQREVQMEVVEQHQGPGPMHQQMPGPMGEPGDHAAAMLHMLRLSPEQQAKFRAIHFEHEKSMIKSRADMEIKRLELEQLLSQPDFKEAEVRAKAQELHTLMAQTRQKSLDVFFQIRNLLTDLMAIERRLGSKQPDARARSACPHLGQNSPRYQSSSCGPTAAATAAPSARNVPNGSFEANPPRLAAISPRPMKVPNNDASIKVRRVNRHPRKAPIIASIGGSPMPSPSCPRSHSHPNAMP